MTPYETLLDLAHENRLEKAGAYLGKFNEGDRIDWLLQLAKDQSPQVAYSITTEMLKKEESAFWHQAASTISFETFHNEEEGRKRSLRHVLKAIENDPLNWKLKEQALTYHFEGKLPARYALPFAKSILRIEPTNQLALSIIEEEIEVY